MRKKQWEQVREEEEEKEEGKGERSNQLSRHHAFSYLPLEHLLGIDGDGQIGGGAALGGVLVLLKRLGHEGVEQRGLALAALAHCHDLAAAKHLALARLNGGLHGGKGAVMVVLLVAGLAPLLLRLDGCARL